MQAVSCGSVTRHFQCCARQLLRRAVFLLGVAPANRLVLRTAVKLCIILLPSAGLEDYHQLPPLIPPSHGFRSRSRRGARLSAVSLAGASPAGTAPAAGSSTYSKAAVCRTLGHEEDSQSAPLGTARHPERNRGARPLSLPESCRWGSGKMDDQQAPGGRSFACAKFVNRRSRAGVF